MEKIYAGIVGAAALCAASAIASAQPVPKDYPNKPIRVIVPSPAGGPPDLIMRMLMPKYSASLGQPLVLDNRVGAGGSVGSAVVAKASAQSPMPSRNSSRRSRRS